MSEGSIATEKPQAAPFASKAYWEAELAELRREADASEQASAFMFGRALGMIEIMLIFGIKDDAR